MVVSCYYIISRVEIQLNTGETTTCFLLKYGFENKDYAYNLKRYIYHLQESKKIYIKNRHNQ